MDEKKPLSAKTKIALVVLTVVVDICCLVAASFAIRTNQILLLIAIVIVFLAVPAFIAKRLQQ